MILFPCLYNPPLNYYLELIKHNDITIDFHEHFVKQTLRTRCRILGPNGMQELNIPTQHSGRNNQPVKDVRIHNGEAWQKKHWRSLCTAYNRSPFFEFYEDELVPLYKKEYNYLLDFTFSLFIKLNELLKITPTCHQSENWIPYSSNDPRIIFSDPAHQRVSKPYLQVFSYKYSFVADTGIMDLLFNEGPASSSYLSSQQ